MKGRLCRQRGPSAPTGCVAMCGALPQLDQELDAWEAAACDRLMDLLTSTAVSHSRGSLNGPPPPDDPRLGAEWPAGASGCWSTARSRQHHRDRPDDPRGPRGADPVGVGEHPRATNSSAPNSTVSHSVATTPGMASEKSAVTASRAPSAISAQKASRSPVVLTQIGDSAAYRPASSVPQSWRRVHGRIQGHLLWSLLGGRSTAPSMTSRVALPAGDGITATPICAFRLAGNGRTRPLAAMAEVNSGHRGGPAWSDPRSIHVDRGLPQAAAA